MVEPHPFRVVGTVPADAAERIRAETAALASLPDVTRWAAASRPPRRLVESLPQDEYTHDVVMDAGAGVHVVFDVT